MATVVNSRDLKLQATSPRFIPVRPQGIYLTESSDNFTVAEDGTALPLDGITYTLEVVGVTATANPVFSVTSGTATLTDVLEGAPPASNPKKKKLLFADMLSSTVVITATLTDTTGAVFTARVTTQKIRESATGVTISTQGSTFRVDSFGVGSPAVMEVYVAPKFLEFSGSPTYTLTAVDSTGTAIPGITLVPDVVKDMTWLLDYDEVAASGELSFGVKVSVTDKYSITHTDTALLDVLVAASSFVRLSSSSPFFVKPKTSSVLTPASITFTALKQGVADAIVWTILNQSGGAISYTTGTDANGNATATITNSQFGSATLATVTATAGSYSDTTTVQLVDEAVDGVFVSMANSVHEFDADAAGSIYSFAGSGSTFTVYEGSTAITTYDSSAPYAAGSYRFGTTSTTTDTGTLSAPVLSSAGLANYSSMSANTATVTIPVIVTKQDGSVVTVNVSQTLVKKKRGAVLSLSSTASSFAYNNAGTTPAPTSATVTALVGNISPTLTTWYSTITVGAGAESARTATTGASKTYTYTPQAGYSSMPETVTVKVYDAASGGNLIATASTGMGATKVGADGGDGRTYSLAVSGGTRSYTYNAAGTASAPTTSSAFSAALTLDGASVTPASYSWSATGRLSGTSTTSTFTPTVNQTYVAESTSVTLTVTHGSPAVSTTVTVPVAIAKVGDTGSNGANGSNGTDGVNALNGTLTKDSYLIPSLQDGTGYTGYLSSAGGTFKVGFGTTDVTTSSIFNIVGGTDAGTTWTKTQNGLTFTINETTGVYSLSGASWTTDSESFTVTATYSGSTVTKVYTITKAKQGLPGKKPVVVKLFKWDTSALIPTADSSYNWSTNTLSLGSVTGWATTVPSSTASGQKLYELSKLLIVDSDYTGTSTVDWNTADVVGPVGVINEIGIRQDGSIGPTGPRGQSGYVYYTLEASTAPATPSATAFNFDTGAFTGLSANWSTAYSVPSASSSTTNEKYWSSRYVVSEATYGGTQTISFSTPFVHTNFDGLVTFTNLTNGTNGSGTGTTFIDGGAITANTVTANKINVTALSAIQSNLGTVDIATAGYVRSGKTTATDTANAGFFLGYTSPTYTFFIGNAGDTVSLKYDGNLTLKGGTVNVGTAGAVYGGQTSFDTGEGFYLGYSGATYKFSVGSAEITGISVNITTDVFTKVAHGLTNGKIVRFSNVGGVTNMTTTYFYYVRDVTANTFKVAEYAGGAALNIAGSAASTLTIAKSNLAWDGRSLELNAGVISGALVRTAASGARVEIGGRNDIVVWNSSGTAVGAWNMSGDGKLFLTNSASTSDRGLIYSQVSSPASIYAGEFQTDAAGSYAVYALNSASSGGAIQAVSWGGNAVSAVSTGSSTNAAVYAENSITAGIAIQAVGQTKLANSSPTLPALTVNNTSTAGAGTFTNNSSSAPAITATNSNASGLAIDANGGVDVANSSTTVSTVKAVNSASGGIAVEASNASPSTAAIVATNSNASGLAIDANGAIDAANNNPSISTVKAVNSASGGVAIEAGGRAEISSTLRVTGLSAPTSGSGVELAFSSGVGYVAAYNRGTSTALPLVLLSSSTALGGVTTSVPATSTSTGTVGQIAWDANYIYVCTATNTWRRTALSTW